MLETTALSSTFDAIMTGQKKHLVLDRVVGLIAGEPVRVVEVDMTGHRTGRGVFARVTFIETVRASSPAGVAGPPYALMVASIEVRMSTDRMPAIVLPRED